MMLLLICNNQSYSQELPTKELQWEIIDTSSIKLCFIDTNMALEWSKHQIPIALKERQGEENWQMTWPVDAYELNVCNSVTTKIKNENLYIVIVVGCSGIACQSFYIFKETGQYWELIATSQARLFKPIEIENRDDRIAFKSNSIQIGELLF
ncbi:MAG: hypothetical protein IPL35_17760 [Sphingobacteriales bacterium]|nr:hypothetical protein [Sphingobacteriales bacterium]